MGTTISNPVSLTSFNPGTVVSDLGNALMKSIGQDLQSGQSADSAALPQEMRLLTELLNQSNESGSNPGPTNSGAPSTGSSDPPTDSGDPSASSTPPSTSGYSSTSTSPTNNGGLDTTESKLETALERNITDRLQNGQTPNNGNTLQQEMNLLIEVLGQGA